MENAARLWGHSRCSDTCMRKTPVIVLVVMFSLACLAQTGGVESVGSPPDSVPTAVVQVLEPHGHRLKLADGDVVCDIWFRKTVPAQTAKQQSEGLLYPELSESMLVGVISFPKATTDFRGQPIAPGTYTLRYELMPDDGNHLGVAPDRDFLLLVGAASDPDPGAHFKFDELVQMSRKATGTNHPGPLSLAQASGSVTSLTKDAEEHWIFSSVLKLDSGKDLPFALIVKGTAAQ
jgi:hypothetical protein